MANTLRFKRGLVSGIPTAALGEPLFTTDTFDLYIGNGTTNTRFQKYIASGTTGQLLRGDGSLLTMPIVLTSPSNGQVLKYDGTNWVNSSDAGVTGSGVNGQVTFWNSASTITGSNNLFWNAANNRLGINTNAPSYTADIRSAAGTVLSLSGGSSTNQGAALYITNSAFTGTLTAFGDSANILGGTPDASATIFTGSSIPLHFYINGGQAARISTSRNFIINNASTDNGLRFQVTGDGYFSGSVGIGTSSIGCKLDVVGAGNDSIQFRTSTRTIGIGQVLGEASLYWGSTTALTFHSGTEKMRLDASGNLGLGVTPSAWGSNSKPLQMADGSIWGSSALTGYASVGGNYFYDGNYKYIKSSTATDYYQYAGEHVWRNAVSGTAGNIITFVQRMTLDSSGNLGLGVVPSAWGSGYKGFEVGSLGGSIFSQTAGNNTWITANAFFNGTNWIRPYATNASAFNLSAGNAAWYTAGSSTAGSTISFTQAMTLFASGNLAVGTTTDAGFKLDVNGTMRVSGASTLKSLLVQDTSSTNIIVVNAGASSYSGIEFQNNGTSNGYMYARADISSVLVRSINWSMDIGTQAAQPLTFTTNSATRLTIASTGAATFSSSVSAANFVAGNATANITLLNGTADQQQIRLRMSGTNGVLDVTRNSGAVPNLIFGTEGTERMRLDGNGNLGIAMTPSYKLDVTGEARVSNAIAIGTTPDTNKPFKILKNINGTVGINFENTSTGSLAFSAIQMGTDVTGGTKFTNLVYSSSGVTASGVYQPDGTSLINNGSGGLNFLGNPIRMYTGGSNGSLRWDMTNDGFITQYTGTNPSTNATDGYRQYSADVVAGNAAPHFRTENGAIIKLYQETTGVGNSIISLGGGNAVLDDTTFDGYTLRQIVKALRNQGILA